MTDAFDDLGVHAYFDDGDALDYVELHSFGRVDPVYEGVVLRGDWNEIQTRLTGLGIEIVVSDTGEIAALAETGIELYRYDPSLQMIDSVMVLLTPGTAIWPQLGG